jgi:3-oxoacyl-[acyl-carrier protein] reductase
MDLGIEGNSAVVAASSSGLGKASAKALAEEGTNVVINGRDPDSLSATADELRETAVGEVVTHPGDLTEPADCEALVERAVGEFGGLDHLVTNAGGPPSGPFLDTDDADWQHAFDLLVKSAVRLCRAAHDPLAADGGGSIVCSTSHSVKEAIDNLVLSNSVRMSVVGLEKTLSREFAPEVRVNVIMPGAHATDRMEYLIQNAVELGEYDSYDESYDAWTEDIPLGRMGDPDRFGQVVAFLCSEPASFINGTAVMVDGGTGRSNL